MEFMNSKSFAVYVSSYDGCVDLWGTFFSMIDRFWSDCQYPVYLINNEYSFEHDKVKVINTGPEVNWFKRTIVSLSNLNEKYIMFMLEDYLISKKIENEIIDEILSFMDDNGVYYYQLSVGNTKSKERIRTKVSAKTSYPVSLQPAIWEREKFLSILKEINGKTPWDVEDYFTRKYHGKMDLIQGAYHDTRDILGYKNGVLRGKWIPSTLKYYKKLGIKIDTGNREIMSARKMNKYRVAGFVHKKVPKGLKEIVKKMLRLLHFDYLK